MIRGKNLKRGNSILSLRISNEIITKENRKHATSLVLETNRFISKHPTLYNKMLSYRAAPNASGMRSTVYLYPLIYMQGTPGIFLIRPRNSLSHVATMKQRHCCAMLVKQSSAYPFFAQLHGTRSKRGSFANLSAILYLPPNFSSSAITQSVTQGIHFANKQSIIARIISSFFLIAHTT